MAEDDVDWNGFGKTHFGTTIDKLNRYSACNVDPFVCQIAQLVCEKFKFPAHGIQNLAHVLGSLPTTDYHNGEIGVGYNSNNVVHLISDTDSGFNFLGICGALLEYYNEDFVVEFFMLLALRSKVPFRMSPTELQWRNLIKVCDGVLATCEFGLLLRRYEDIVKTGHSNNPSSMLDLLITMTTKEKATLMTGRDTPWFAAVAEMMFDKKFTIKNGDHLAFGNNADLVFEYDDTTDAPQNTGGRVPWDTIFQTCFGQAFKDIDKDCLAMIIAGVSAFVHRSILDSKHDSRVYFLPQVSEIPALAGTGLNETIMAWFPEIRRLASRIEKVNIMAFDDFRDHFVAAIKKLETSCTCTMCGTGSESSSDICLASLTQTIVFIGFYVARMVVIPKLYPKRSGVLAFYERFHQGRLRRKEQPDQQVAIEQAEFVKQISAAMPTPFQMLESAQLLFTGSTCKLDPQTLGVSHTGVSVVLNNLKSISDDSNTNLKTSLFVSSGILHYHNRIFRHSYWDNGIADMSYTEQFEIARTKPNEISQAARLRDTDLLISYIWRNKDQESKAEAAGWDLIDKYEGLSLAS